MDENLEEHVKSNVRGSMETEENDVEKSNKCNHCDYATSYASALRTRLKTHRGEKTNKCSQCEFASFQAVLFEDTFGNIQ